MTVDGSTAKLAAAAQLPRLLLPLCSPPPARLTAPARDAVEMASVLGHSFSLDELAGLLGRPLLDLRGEVREAIAAGLLTEQGDRLGFRHDLVREAVDASLPKAVRRSMRRTAIEAMLRHGASAAAVAQLVMDVAEPGDVASAALLRRAAAQIGQVSPAVAAPLSRRALDLTPRGDPERGEAAMQAIDLLVQAGRAAEAANLLTVSEGDLADPVAQARARLGVGLLMTQYAPAAVAEQCQAALRLPGVPPAVRVQLLSRWPAGWTSAARQMRRPGRSRTRSRKRRPPAIPLPRSSRSCRGPCSPSPRATGRAPSTWRVRRSRASTRRKSSGCGCQRRGSRCC